MLGVVDCTGCQKSAVVGSLTHRPLGPSGDRSSFLERLNREIKRRSRVVGIFLKDTPSAINRLIGAVLADAH